MAFSEPASESRFALRPAKAPTSGMCVEYTRVGEGVRLSGFRGDGKQLLQIKPKDNRVTVRFDPHPQDYLAVVGDDAPQVEVVETFKAADCLWKLVIIGQRSKHTEDWQALPAGKSVSLVHKDRAETGLKILLIHSKSSHLLAPGKFPGEACKVTLETEADAASHITGFHSCREGVFVLDNCDELPPLLERSAWILEHVTSRLGPGDFLPIQCVFPEAQAGDVKMLLENAYGVIKKLQDDNRSFKVEVEAMATTLQGSAMSVQRSEDEIKKTAAATISAYREFLDFIKYPIAFSFLVWAACQIIALWH